MTTCTNEPGAEQDTPVLKILADLGGRIVIYDFCFVLFCSGFLIETDRNEVPSNAHIHSDR